MNQQDPIYYWAQQRVPTIATNVINDSSIPEMDHLYIDCSELLFTSLKNKKYTSLKELVKSITAIIEEIKQLVQPKTLLFLSFDGTVPVQMQQKLLQRVNQIGKLAKNQISYMDLLPGSEKAVEFEKLFSESLRTLNKRTDEKSMKLKILYQGINVAGDSQQKINDFIRKQRVQAVYGPNVKHCIMSSQTEGKYYNLVIYTAFITALSSHELDFYVLSNQVIHDTDLECLQCGNKGHNYFNCKQSANDKKVGKNSIKYQLYTIQEFRQCLAQEFIFMESIVNSFNIENLIDDFCLLLITIHHAELVGFRLQKSLDIFLYIYKRIYPFFDGYMTQNGDIDMINYKIFLKVLAQSEQAVIQNFYRIQYFSDKKNNQQDSEFTELIKTIKKQIAEEYESDSENEETKEELERKEKEDQAEKEQKQQDEQKDIIQKLLVQNVDQIEADANITNIEQTKPEDQEPPFHYNVQDFFKDKLTEDSQYVTLDHSEAAYYEIVKNSQKYCERYLEGSSFYSLFGNVGTMESELISLVTGDKNYKTEFYKKYFDIDVNEIQKVTDFLKVLQQQYLILLQWWHSFYYKGYLSWKWSYKYDYPPFISDIVENIDTVQLNIEVGLPIKPVEQRLMLVDFNQQDQVPQLFKFLVEDKPKAEELGLFLEAQPFIDHWSGEFQKQKIKNLKTDDIISICQNYEEFLTEEDQKLNRKGKSIMIASWKNVSSEQNQVRSLLNWEEHQISCELFLLEEINATYSLYGLLTPFFKESPLCTLVDNAQSEYQIKYTDEYAESLDLWMYRNNEVIKMLERSLSSQFERNELFNKGLDKHVPQPPPVSQPQHHHPSHSQHHVQNSPQLRQNYHNNNRPNYNSGYQGQNYNPNFNKRQPQYQLTPPPYQSRQNPRYPPY